MGPPNATAELILIEGGAGVIEVAFSIEIRVAEKLEGVTVKLACARFADDSDDAAVVVAVFGIEVCGKDAELFDGVEVWDDGGAAVHVLLHVDTVDHEAVGGFALAVDGEVAGVGVAGGVEAAGYTSHDDGAGEESRDGGYAGLDGEKVGVAAAVQGERCHLSGRDDLAEMSGRGLDLYACVTRYRNGVGSLADLEDCINTDSGIGVHYEVGLSLGAEAGGGDGQVVVADGEVGKDVEALLVGDSLIGRLLGGVDQLEDCA